MKSQLKKLKGKRWFWLASNIYTLVITAFLIWMIFLDTNSLVTHSRLNKEIEKLKAQKQKLKKEIEKDKALIKQLQDPDLLEKFARERYKMQKENETVFIIEYEDSLKNKQP